MKRKTIIPVLVLYALIIFSKSGRAQDSTAMNQFNFGIGLGIDYGGLGVRLTYMPVKYCALFVAGGTNFVDPAYNVGAAFRILPGMRACPYIGFMYGYNAVIKITNAAEYNKTYYATSMPFGVEIHSKKKRNNFWNIELIIPFRSKQFTDDWDAIKANPNIKVSNDPAPVMFSFGYHFGIG